MRRVLKSETRHVSVAQMETNPSPGGRLGFPEKETKERKKASKKRKAVIGSFIQSMCVRSEAGQPSGAFSGRLGQHSRVRRTSYLMKLHAPGGFLEAQCKSFFPCLPFLVLRQIYLKKFGFLFSNRAALNNAVPTSHMVFSF